MMYIHSNYEIDKRINVSKQGIGLGQSDIIQQGKAYCVASGHG